MRHRFILLAAVALFVSPMLSELASTQDQAQAPQPGGSVQVGVPQGRGAAPAPGRQGGPGRGRQTGPPPGPAPRSADGRALLGGGPGKKGVFLPGGGGNTTAGSDTPVIPFQPWAKALYANRGINQLEPHTRCKPSGGIRQFLTPYGVEFVDLPEIQRIYIFDIGGPHTYRTIFMDGRTHPANLVPSYYGHSIGWWEGDTLVVDTVGYNETFWLDRRGLPTTEKLRTLERFTRTDAATIKYEMTIDDPGAYTATWKTGFNLRWEDGTELFEYVCQQANYAHELMVGGQKSIDRTSVIVP
jgi:hypothetical protein